MQCFNVGSVAIAHGSWVLLVKSKGGGGMVSSHSCCARSRTLLPLNNEGECNVVRRGAHATATDSGDIDIVDGT